MLKYKSKVIAIKGGSGPAVLDHDITVPAGRGYATGELIRKGTPLADIIAKEFTVPKVTITVVSANPSQGSATGGGSFDVGQIITISAAPNAGYVFDKWQDGDTTNPRSVTVTSAMTFTASFKLSNYNVTVTNDGQGTGTATPASAQPGTQITLAASPNAGKRFKQWQVISGGVTVFDNKFTMPANDVEVKAIFEDSPVPTHEITITAGAGGSTSPAGPSIAVVEGQSQKITAVPNSGYEVETILIDGTAQPAGTTEYTFTNVTAAHTFNVTFKALPVMVTISGVAAPAAAVSAGCKVKVNGKDGSDTVEQGTSMLVQAIPGGAYSFVSWDDASTDNPRSIIAATNTTYTATFDIITVKHKVTVTPSENGTTDKTGDNMVDDGSTLTITATPSAGYEVEYWKVDGVTVQTGGLTFTTPAVTKDLVITVSFKLAASLKFLQGWILDTDDSGRTRVPTTSNIEIKKTFTKTQAEIDAIVAGKSWEASYYGIIDPEHLYEYIYAFPATMTQPNRVIDEGGDAEEWFSKDLTIDGADYKVWYSNFCSEETKSTFKWD